MQVQFAQRAVTFYKPDPDAHPDDEAWRAFGEGLVWDDKRADDAIAAAVEARQNGNGHKVSVDA